VGVTYGGNSVTEAEQLIDRVKNYTNLFVVASGSWQSNNVSALLDVGDYAVASGLNVFFNFGTNAYLKDAVSGFIDAAQARWGSRFLGIYYGDEPGGKMLDAQVQLYSNNPNETLYKYADGSLYVIVANGTLTSARLFYPSGQITIDDSLHDATSHSVLATNITQYYSNGTLSFSVYSDDLHQTLLYQPDGTVQTSDGITVTNAGDISQFTPYQQVWDSRPLQTQSDAANAYVGTQKQALDWIHKQANVTIFTSDYALYWWDYQSGYDMVLAELGWNNSVW
jgi:hypothetical protein